MTKQYISVSGNTGKDPQPYPTKSGEVVKFSIAQKTGYGEDDTRWYQVAVFNEGLKQRVLSELHKGSRCVVEGFAEEQGEYGWQIVADRVGICEWFQPTKKNQTAPAAAATTGGYSEDV